jgi:hypothetical protein
MDFYHDPGHGTLRHLLQRAPQAAELLKTAELEDFNSELPDSAFAWSAKRLYPVHSPEHAIVSHLYAKYASENVPPEVLRTIKEALDIFEIPEESLRAEEIKEAAFDPDECLFPEERLYPVRTAGEIKVAERRLHEQLFKLHPESRAEAFSRLANAADLHGVKLATVSMQLAGRTYTDSRQLVRDLHARAAATKEASIREKYARLAESVAKDRQGLRDQLTRAKLAATIGTLDEAAGVVGLYDRAIPDPLTTVYNTTKIAAADDLDLGGGQMVSAAALSQLPPSFFADLFGQDIVREVAPSGQVQPELVQQVVSTFPADMKQTLAKALVSAGVPMAQV